MAKGYVIARANVTNPDEWAKYAAKAGEAMKIYTDIQEASAKAAEDVLQRLAQRKQAGTDASEAGPELYDAMLSQFEPPLEWPPERKASINTSDPKWKSSVGEAVANLRTN